MESTLIILNIDAMIAILLENGATASQIAGALQGRVVTLMDRNDAIELLNHALDGLQSTPTIEQIH
jgi:hypothetical protein